VVVDGEVPVGVDVVDAGVTRGAGRAGAVNFLTGTPVGDAACVAVGDDVLLTFDDAVDDDDAVLLLTRGLFFGGGGGYDGDDDCVDKTTWPFCRC
jgi:hypothetical protein